MSRNPLGARRPTPIGPPPPPRILPDGSESLQHGGSVGAYMALKARKLGVSLLFALKTVPQAGQLLVVLCQPPGLHLLALHAP